MANRRLAPAAEQPQDFAFTSENADWARGQIAKYPEGRQASAVIPLLWKAQEQNGGWLPRAAIEAVADELGMPHIRVLEVATFYTMFALEPVGRFWIQLCGTVPCDCCGAKELKAALHERLGPAGHVSADGNFSWLEVECLGACCNAPMVQINQDYYEDLNPESLNKLMDDLAAGRPVKVGSQIGRVSSEPKDAVNTLTDESLFDGSRVGAWRKRFEQTEGAAEEGVKKDEAASTEARVKNETKPAHPSSGRANETNAVDAPAERASAGEVPVKAEDRDDARDAKAPPAQDPAVEEDEILRTEPPQHPATVGAGDDVPEGENPEARADAAGTRPKGLDAPRDDRPDDLTKIKGVGPINQRRLNDLGIWHYDQVAAWSPPEVAWVSAYLAFPGRIDRENWVGQASDLAGSRG
ncbi:MULTISPECIES: NADH-quinone oxidoreductase subunit NuoE [Methylorubrum]|uniref:NADH-quinone oxidoreductase subunit NuoE n=1 Tax=Methylorubrum TaxID=2282523 RepID=UPI0020A1BED0|nr:MULTISPECIES: NADH-quinone oxidoreductase subunit NuoE [Methylorubrum]MCP1547082.1 NADH-quinone oxidoreductase subunit E [Methylorubrum zatmanii]MCP1556302.1 NADH-quinone oxidoreductase subunit E [Methylorubrum extorquens]MCP1577385.1 NADH-quinone oxidoreductase subunit E [Methylorubrum extorquens]